MVEASASPERMSCSTAIIQLFTLTYASSSGRSRRSFCSKGSAITATSWLGSIMFSMFLTNVVTLSISSRVTDCYTSVSTAPEYRAGELTSVACELCTAGTADFLGRPNDLCRTWKPCCRVEAALASIFRAWDSCISSSLSRHWMSGCFTLSVLCGVRETRVRHLEGRGFAPDGLADYDLRVVVLEDPQQSHEGRVLAGLP